MANSTSIQSADIKPDSITPDFIASTLFAQHQIRGLFTLRGGGISPAPFDSLNFGSGLGDNETNITAHVNALMTAANLSGTPHQAVQTHQTDSLWCNGSGHLHKHSADILLSDQTDTPLAVRTADCLPILLAEPQTGICAAVHAGWRGTAAGIAIKAVQAMCAHGANAEHIIASLGPCIGSCCFEIGEQAANALRKCTESASDFVQQTADLRQINRLQLCQSGLSEHNIELIHACTACDSKHFFSFRRDAGQTGRHIAIVAIPSKP